MAALSINLSRLYPGSGREIHITACASNWPAPVGLSPIANLVFTLSRRHSGKNPSLPSGAETFEGKSGALRA